MYLKTHFEYMHALSSPLNYIDSPPSRSPGRKEFRLDGVARDCSALSNGDVPHKLAADALLGQPVLHVSAAAPPVTTGCLLEAAPRHAPEPPPCWLVDICWRIVFVSHSFGFSARIVVLPRTQLFSVAWAWNTIQYRYTVSTSRSTFAPLWPPRGSNTWPERSPDAGTGGNSAGVRAACRASSGSTRRSEITKRARNKTDRASIRDNYLRGQIPQEKPGGGAAPVAGTALGAPSCRTRAEIARPPVDEGAALGGQTGWRPARLRGPQLGGHRSAGIQVAQSLRRGEFALRTGTSPMLC